jgi:hypothetical protein
LIPELANFSVFFVALCQTLGIRQEHLRTSANNHDDEWNLSFENPPKMAKKNFFCEVEVSLERAYTQPHTR